MRLYEYDEGLCKLNHRNLYVYLYVYSDILVWIIIYTYIYIYIYISIYMHAIMYMYAMSRHKRRERVGNSGSQVQVLRFSGIPLLSEDGDADLR